MRPPKWFIRLLGRAQAPVYRATRGRVFGRVGNARVLLLTTTGRRSGRARTVPLLYVPDGERLVVVASQGGHDTHPAWYLNLRADPVAIVEVDGVRRRVRAHVLGLDERDRLWPELVAAYPAWAAYRGRTDREFPLLALVPVP